MSALFTAILLPLLSFPFAQHYEPFAGMTYETAWASQYAQEPTDYTLDYRQGLGEIPQDLSRYTVFVATTLFCDVGSAGYIRPVVDGERGEWEHMLLVDCAGHADTVENFFRPNNIQVEIDYYTAARWDTIGRGIEVDIIWLDQ